MWSFTPDRRVTDTEFGQIADAARCWRRTLRRILGTTRVDLHAQEDGTVLVGKFDR